MELLQMMEQESAWSGLQSRRGGNRPGDWGKRMAAAIRLVENRAGMSSLRWKATLEEASKTSDFPYLLGDVIDRKLMAAYTAAPKVMRQIVRVDPHVPNFNTVKRDAFDAILTPMQQVPEQGNYTATEAVESQYTYALKKWGKLYLLSWEAWINDDLGAFNRLPGGLAESAMATEDYFLTKLFWDANGPLDAYFAHATLGQKAVSALPLTIANLETAIAQMTGSGGSSTNYLSDAGMPIVNIPKYLVVPPSLMMEATRILATTQAAWTSPSATSGTADISAALRGTLNVVATMGLQLIVNPWIPVVVTSGTKGQTTWALFSQSIPCAELGLLNGHNTPELFMKASGSQYMGGGAADPFSGSFENDTVAYKCRYCFNGVRLDPRGGWASDGQ